MYPAYRQRPVQPSQSFSDLSKQTEIKYGTIASGSTMDFFKESRITVYKRMWQFMSSAKPSVFVMSSLEGISRVLEGGYVFMSDFNVLNYVASHQCELQVIASKSLLSSVDYGVAFPIGSSIQARASIVILKMHETGVIRKLDQKWSHEKGNCPTNEETEQGGVCGKQTAGHSVDVEMFAGPLVLMVIGVLLSLLAATVEIIVARSFGQVGRILLIRTISFC